MVVQRWSVGPKSETSGVANAAAMWRGPVSLVTMSVARWTMDLSEPRVMPSVGSTAGGVGWSAGVHALAMAWQSSVSAGEPLMAIERL